MAVKTTVSRKALINDNADNDGQTDEAVTTPNLAMNHRGWRQNGADVAAAAGVVVA